MGVDKLKGDMDETLVYNCRNAWSSQLKESSEISLPLKDLDEIVFETILSLKEQYWSVILWYVIPCDKEFHAIVSVMAVKIQFSSPSGVLRSLSLPGILLIKCQIKVINTGAYLSNMSSDTPWINLPTFCKQNLYENGQLFLYNGYTLIYQCKAVLIGAVKQEVKRSAGRRGFIGRSSLAPQDAKSIDSLRRPKQFIEKLLRLVEF